MLKKIIFTILFSFFLISEAYSKESFISLEKLKNHDMDKVILRHALAQVMEILQILTLMIVPLNETLIK